MTDAEYDSAAESISSDAELIADRIGTDVADVTSTVADSASSMETTVITAAESTDGIFETVLEGVLPVTVGAKCAHGVWTSTKDMETSERIAVTAGAGGLGVLATTLVVANPLGAACVAAYGTYKLINLGTKLWDKYA